MSGENQSDQQSEPHRRREETRQVQQGGDNQKDQPQQAEQVWQHRQWGSAFERRKQDSPRSPDGNNQRR